MKEIEIRNKKAYFDYFIEDSLEVGIVLEGKEVKAIKQGKCNLKGSWCRIVDNEMYVLNMHISNYQESSHENSLNRLDPYRTRKLLLHRKQINKLKIEQDLKNVTFVPLRLYFNRGKAKIEMGICTGKKKYDKREEMKKEDLKRKMREY